MGPRLNSVKTSRAKLNLYSLFIIRHIKHRMVKQNFKTLVHVKFK